ncbi:diguanylate cyclase (GGDEF)-like protein [Halanaerobium saccharolyticum]|uniref:Diguanylate cyclase (GGDEF)-like protein n=1 Tax=Halanaerobium saccharolyticum TaxID=43595 RepID=A0A2T5RRM6_9FIRM|nr:GGDEF domain-containing protein [Halanaerobium saccharolyticum]PTW02789.1 diguanylate cyclase (GGDEF)-like protein [Halanaerobium saccharolyticum]
MNFEFKNLSNKKISTLTYAFLTINGLILTSKLFLGTLNDQTDFLFGFSYFLLFIIIYDNFLKNSDDKKAIILWLAQILFYVIFLYFESYLIIKTIILIQVLFGVISSGKQIKAFKRQNEKIRYLSFHDEMTGLHNRRYFENKLEALDDPKKHNPSVIIADINNLKVINDNHGHKKGDEYIKSAANLLKSELREKDIISRIGGDEFAIILPETNKEECKKIITRIKEKAKKHPEKYFSIAFGYIYDSSKYQSLEAMINAADRKMYHNKKKIKEKINLDLKRGESWE